ncbi:hypothetical protein [Bacillus thuringiensis]|uniref:hypothetical protein n=1 Tax=Bacillus thuringiensis TaxID=1428 RepID=UPI002FBD62AC
MEELFVEKEGGIQKRANRTKGEKIVDNFLFGWRRIRRANKRLRAQNKKPNQRRK